MKICIYAGSFDPVTNGHIDIIKRAVRLCEKLIVAVGNNSEKKTFFSVDERMELLKEALIDIESVEVDSFTGLLVNYAQKKNATSIIKGLRAISDFEYEFQMDVINKNLCSDIETLFMMTNINYSYISSSAVKALAVSGGSIEGLVPDVVRESLYKKLSNDFKGEEML